MSEIVFSNLLKIEVEESKFFFSIFPVQDFFFFQAQSTTRKRFLDGRSWSKIRPCLYAHAQPEPDSTISFVAIKRNFPL